MFCAGAQVYLADQLHNLVEVILLLKHLTHCLPDVDEVWVKLLVERLQRLQTCTEASIPMLVTGLGG